MAQVIVRDLIESSGVEHVAICGRSLKKAKMFSDELKDPKAMPVEVDVTKKDTLKKAIQGFDVVINASWYEYNLDVMKAAIETGVSYVDLGGLYHMTLRQLELDHEAQTAGLTCVLGAGSTPGTMNVMAAYAAENLEHIDRVRLRSGYAVLSKKTERLQMPYSLRTVLDEFTKPAPILKDGKITVVPALSLKEKFTLPEPVGEVEGFITIHSELATLPKNLGKGVKDMDFVVAYEPDFTSAVSTIVKLGLAEKKEIVSGGIQISPFAVVSTLIESLPKETVLEVDIQRVEVEGKKDNADVVLRYDAVTFPHKRWNVGGGTVDTGVPPSIVAQWIASGKIKKRGVLPPELCLDPLQYFGELNLRDRGIRVYKTYQEHKPLF